MAQVVKQDDGTYDIVGMSKSELDILTTFVGSVIPNLPNELDDIAYNLYVQLRDDADATYHPEWIGSKPK